MAEKEVDLHIWKIVYYQVIEMLKTAYLDTENTGPESRQILKSQLLLLFEEGADYYNQLLTDLGKAFNVDLDRFYDALEPRELSRCGRYQAGFFWGGGRKVSFSYFLINFPQVSKINRSFSPF